MKPPWLKLLDQWRSNNRFGLTIPFLVGAMREWPGKPPGKDANTHQELCALLMSIRDEAPEGTIVRLYSCDTIRDLALAPVSGVPQHCFPVSPPNGRDAAFYVERDTIAKEENFDGLLSALYARYKDDIGAGNFSRRAGVYQPMSKDDRKLIRDAIKAPEEVADV